MTMLEWAILLPFAGFLVLVIAGSRLPRRAVAVIGAGSVSASAVLAITMGIRFLASTGASEAHTEVLWSWLSVGGLSLNVGLHLDALSLVMMFVVTFVAALIHIYSTGFMCDDPDYHRFFAYMNLFVGSMLLLVLADNFLLLYLGWEGVGLCSYLLIGFWYRDSSNGRAAMKAFIVTRVGDAAMALGIFMIFTQLGTLNIQQAMARAGTQWPVGSMMATAAAALLLAGAVGKSAQLPLQTWLPDAMAGPTPVSALIHAATMVTAGVYLIARTHVLFSLAPTVQLLVAIIGAATLVLASFSALAQTDIKRVQAYSTMSQVGYMFLALGVGAWPAAIFHLMTHAFFKSLLFLAAGAVIIAFDDEHNIYKMGALRRKLPVAYWCYLAGAASLAALPLVTAGFYSKDLILHEVWSSTQGAFWLYALGLVGALLTGIYIFRVFFVAFAGPERGHPERKTSPSMIVPMVVLATLAIVAGFVEIPKNLGNFAVFTPLLHQVLPEPTMVAHEPSRFLTQGLAAAASLGGIFFAWVVFARHRERAAELLEIPAFSATRRLWHNGWDFDELYHLVFVRSWTWISQVNASDFIDYFYRAIAKFVLWLNRPLSRTQTGRVRDYAIGIALGAVAITAIVVLRQ